MNWLNTFPVGYVVGIVTAPIVYEMDVVLINYVLGKRSKLEPKRRG